MWFIFANSLENGVRSSSHSQNVAQGVQDAIEIIAPSSPVATATGSSFDKFHAAIRKCAHFLEFALLGFSLALSCRAYTSLKSFWLLPPVLSFLTAATDEYIQKFTPGRVCALKDVLIDFSGALAGMLVAVLCIIAVRALYKKIGKRKRKATQTAV